MIQIGIYNIHVVRQIDGKIDKLIDEQKNGQMDGNMNRQMDRVMDRHGKIYVQIGGWKDRELQENIWNFNFIKC